MRAQACFSTAVTPFALACISVRMPVFHYFGKDGAIAIKRKAASLLDVVFTGCSSDNLSGGISSTTGRCMREIAEECRFNSNLAKAVGDKLATRKYLNAAELKVLAQHLE